ncbi:MAG: pyridoxal-phosphate dependent enzyme [bacterium]|nr:pyridoxal-phosphate dependent enzyme [bacterium]
MGAPAVYVLRCVTCGRDYPAAQAPAYVCPACAAQQQPGLPLRGVLECVYDYARYRRTHAPASARTKVLFPPLPHAARLLDVGNTPLYPSPRLAQQAGLRTILLKDETVEPTHSYKDRASWLVVQMALAQKADTLVCASTGNAASSLAGICAAAGLPCHLFVSRHAPRPKLLQLTAMGATLHLVDGTYDDCFEQSLQATQAHGWYNRNTAYNPWTIEGKKTAAWEIAWQCDFDVPEQIFVPTGDGVILAGMFKGFYDLQQLGWLARIPRLVAVQPAGADALATAWERGEDGRAALRADAASCADSLVVRAPRNAVLALRALRACDGYALRVTDDEILAALRALPAATGVFVEPAAAAAYAGLLAARAHGRITAGDRAVLLLTGSGFKDMASVERALATAAPR